MLGHNLSHIRAVFRCTARAEGPPRHPPLRKGKGGRIVGAAGLFPPLRRGGWGGEFRIEPLELLESFLVDDAGAVLLISHDRGLPNAVDTSALVIEDDGLIREHEGSNDTDRPQRP